MGDIIKGPFNEDTAEPIKENVFEKARRVSEFLGQITIDPERLEREVEYVTLLGAERAGLDMLDSEKKDWLADPEYYFALCVRFKALTLETPPPSDPPTFFPAA